MGQAKKDPSKLAEAEAVKKQVTDEAERLAALEKLEAELDEKVHHIMLQIPQIIDPSVPIRPGRFRQRRGPALRRGQGA